MFANASFAAKMAEKVAAEEMKKHPKKKKASEETISLGDSSSSIFSLSPRARLKKTIPKAPFNEEPLHPPNSINCTSSVASDRDKGSNAEKLPLVVLPEKKTTAQVLEDVREAIDAQKEKQVHYGCCIQEQLRLAKARRDADNARGAVMSMKKIHRWDEERSKVTKALNYLQSKEQEIRVYLEEEQEKSCRSIAEEHQAQDDSISTISLPTLAEDSLDSIWQVVANILNENVTAASADDEELLRALEIRLLTEQER